VNKFRLADITKEGNSWLLTIDGKLLGRFDSIVKAIRELIRIDAAK